MRLSRGRLHEGESGMQQSALNRLAAAKDGFAQAPEWDSWRPCLRSIRCSDHCEGAWTGFRTSAAVLLQRLDVGRQSSVRGNQLTSQAATSNSAKMSFAWALMSRPPMFRTCPFLIIAIAS
jgi:hypothetical protein